MTTSAAYILFVDDDRDDQEMFAERFLLQNPSAVIEYVSDGLQALSFLQSRSDSDLPTIIFLDYKMPGLTGAEVLQSIEKDRRYQHIPKIVWSTSGNHEYMEKCLRFGAERYFIKPSEVKRLDEIVAYLTRVYRTRAHS